MADFRANMTSVAAVDDSIVLAYDQAFLIASEQGQIMDQFVSLRRDIDAKSIDFTKYSQMALATTALTDKEDAASVALADSKITLTPLEYGAVITKTELAKFQTGGSKLDIASAELVGLNAGRTQDKLCVLAGEGSANEVFSGQASEAAITATDVTSVSFMNELYNKLGRGSVVPMFEDGLYCAVLHDDQIHDLRNSSGAGSWQDISKYQSSEQVLKNEVGTIAGFRVFRNNHISINADAGATTVDTYHGMYFGKNALGKAVSKEVEARMTGPFDALGRFLNVGWYGIFAYGIVDADAMYLGTSASSVGTN